MSDNELNDSNGSVLVRDGEPCSRGCQQHVSHPCEKCGRTQARGEIRSNPLAENKEKTRKF